MKIIIILVTTAFFAVLSIAAFLAVLSTAGLFVVLRAAEADLAQGFTSHAGAPIGKYPVGKYPQPVVTKRLTATNMALRTKGHEDAAGNHIFFDRTAALRMLAGNAESGVGRQFHGAR